MSRWYKRSANVEALEVEQEWMILHADQYTVTKLNEIGGFCWALLRENQSADSLAQELLKEYDIGEEEARRDIETFLCELQRLGLIEYAS